MENSSYKNFRSLSGNIDNPAALALLSRHPSWAVRRGVARNSHTSEETRAVLRRDPDLTVSAEAGVLYKASNFDPNALELRERLAVLRVLDDAISGCDRFEKEMEGILAPFKPDRTSS